MRFSRKAVIHADCAFIAIVSVLAIVGWNFDIPYLKSLVPGFITMKANTAILFLSLAIAHWIFVQYRRARFSEGFVVVISLFISVVSVLTLIEYAAHIDLGIDQLFFNDLDPMPGRFPPGRTAPIASICFLFASASLMLANNPWKRFHKLSQFLDLTIGLVALQGLTGYLCGINSKFGLAFYTQMAIPTTVLFMTVAISQALLHSKGGFIAILRSTSISGSMARRLLLAAAFLPALVTWFQLHGEKAGWMDREGGLLVRTTGMALLLLLVIWKTAKELYDSERKRTESETAKYLNEKESKLHNAHLAAIIATQYQIATAGMNLEKVIDLAVDRAKALLQADGTIVEMVSGDELHYRAASGVAKQHLGLRLKLDSSFSGLCVREKRLLKCDDTETDRRVNAEACRKVGVGSMVVAPLLHEDQVIGVFKAYSSAKNAFTEAHVNTLQLVGGLIAAALSRAQAFSEKQKAQEEAQRAAQTKAEFLANMSHEIRTPLNGVIGIADLLAEMPLEPQQKKYADLIRSSGQGLLAIVNDILDFSKIEAGRMDLELIEFNLDGLVQSQVGLLSSVAAEKGLSVITAIDSSLNGMFRGDPGRLGQILVNLVGNAIKFTSSGGVSVRVKCGEVLGPGETRIRFEVQDTGVGIPNDVVKKLFKPFTQADGSTARRYGGTGLGLSISKRLTEMMGGQIGVESEPGRGSTFWFTVRLQSVKASEAAKVESRSLSDAGVDTAGSDCSKIRVLVAEDNSINQMVALAQLKAMGYSAQTVANGKEAVDAYCSGQFHLILMDCQMPEMDGFEATQRIREIEAKGGKRIPIIALTANAMKEGAEKCVQFGMDGFISKPVKREQLQAVLERYLLGAKDKAA